MKYNKKLIGLIIGLACVVLCVVLLLTMCNGKPDDGSINNADDELQATAAVEATEATDASEATEVTEEPTEESTEPTEETTEPTEDSTPSGSSRPGGQGGFVGSTVPGTGDGEGETDTPSEPSKEEIEVEDPGTQNNAYTEYLNKSEEAISSINSVMIPAGGSIYYNLYNVDGLVLTIADADACVIYDSVTYGADENGMVQVKLYAVDEETPVSFQLGNVSSEQELYTMQFAEPLGSVDNPEVIEDISSVTASMDEDDAAGYYYSWTAPYDCTLSLNVESITPAETQYDLIVTVGEKIVKASEIADGIVSVELLANEEAIIQVIVQPEGTTAELVIKGTVSGAPGSVNNPYEEYMKDRTSFETALIPADEYVHYNVYDVGGMTLTIENSDAYVVYDNVTYGADANGIVTLRIPAGEDAEAPAELVFGNLGEEEESFTVSFTYPMGGADEPQILQSLGAMSASVSSEYEGYYYSWTAITNGVLSVNVMDVTNLTDSAESVVYDIIINNVTKNSVMTLSTDGWINGSEYPTVSNNVETGDEVQIIVTVDGGESTTVAQFEMLSSISGTSDIMFFVSADLVKIPAASWQEVYSYTRSGGQILTVTGAADLKLIVNGTEYAPDGYGVIKLTTPAADPRNPVQIQLVSSSASAKTYTMLFEYPLGHMYNPEKLQMGQTVVNVPAGSENGYTYTWTAPDDGVLSLTVNEDHLNLANITMVNQSSYEIINLWEMGEANAVNPMTMEVAAGQEIQINVTARNTSYPAIQLVMQASYEAAYGSMSNPIRLESVSSSVTVPAGKTLYYVTDVAGMDATISGDNVTVVYNGETFTSDNGVVTLTLTAAGESSIIGITNSSSTDAAYTVAFAYPVGHPENPQTVTDISSLNAVIPAGSESYYFSWDATSTGVLSATVLRADAESYEVTINNQTMNSSVALSTGGWVNGFDYPVVSNLITQGDRILIGVSVSESASNVSVTLSGSISGTSDMQLYMSSNEVRIPAASSHTVYAYTRIGGQILTIPDAADLTLTVNGTEYTADTSGVIKLDTPETDMNNPLEMTLVSTSETVKVYTLNFEYPLGHMYNPEKLKMGTVNVSIPAGSDNGYTYSWTAPADGVLSIAVADSAAINATLIHQGNYETISVWQWDSTVNREVAVSPITMNVAAGDEVQLNVIARNAGYPAVESSVVASFAPTVVEEPKGTLDNPEEIENLDKIKVMVAEGSEGYYYTWTAKEDGILTFDLEEESRIEGVRSDIVLIRETTEDETALWVYEEAEWAEMENVSMEVRQGDEILILVTATIPVDTYDEDAVISCLAAELTICGEFTANSDVAPVEVPVPAQAKAAEETVPAEEVQPSQEAASDAPAAEPPAVETVPEVSEDPAATEPVTVTEPVVAEEPAPQETQVPETTEPAVL